METVTSEFKAKIELPKDEWFQGGFAVVAGQYDAEIERFEKPGKWLQETATLTQGFLKIRISNWLDLEKENSNNSIRFVIIK